MTMIAAAPNGPFCTYDLYTIHELSAKRAHVQILNYTQFEQKWHESSYFSALSNNFVFFWVDFTTEMLLFYLR